MRRWARLAATRDALSRSTFAVPAALAFLSLAGLVLALVADGAAHGAAWAMLGAPVIAAAWAFRR